MILYWFIAGKMGVTPQTISRWTSFPLAVKPGLHEGNPVRLLGLRGVSITLTDAGDVPAAIKAVAEVFKTAEENEEKN